MFAGINMFLARQNDSEKAQNLFIPKNIECIAISIILEGIPKTFLHKLIWSINTRTFVLNHLQISSLRARVRVNNV